MGALPSYKLHPRRAIISGSGTIASPPGAVATNPALTGTASFAFNTSAKSSKIAVKPPT